MMKAGFFLVGLESGVIFFCFFKKRTKFEEHFNFVSLINWISMASTLVSDENEKQCVFESYKDFGKRFSDKAFKNHKYQYHNESYKLNYIDQQDKKKKKKKATRWERTNPYIIELALLIGNEQHVEINRVNDLLTCKFCSKKYNPDECQQWWNHSCEYGRSLWSDQISWNSPRTVYFGYVLNPHNHSNVSKSLTMHPKHEGWFQAGNWYPIMRLPHYINRSPRSKRRTQSGSFVFLLCCICFTKTNKN